MKVHSHLSCSGVGIIAALRDLAAQELYQHTAEDSLVRVYSRQGQSHERWRWGAAAKGGSELWLTGETGTSSKLQS